MPTIVIEFRIVLISNAEIVLLINILNNRRYRIKTGIEKMNPKMTHKKPIPIASFKLFLPETMSIVNRIKAPSPNEVSQCL